MNNLQEALYNCVSASQNFYEKIKDSFTIQSQENDTNN